MQFLKTITLLTLIFLLQGLPSTGNTHFVQPSQGIGFKGPTHQESAFYTVANDTLQLVPQNDFLTYPFGKFTTIKGFKNAYAGSIISDTKRFSPYPATPSQKAKLYYVLSGNSYVGTFLNKATQNLEIVSSIVLNDAFPLANGIKVGMSKADFLKRVTDTSVADLANIRIVHLASTENKAIHHYYQFSNDKLASITILSDYFYQVK